MTDILNNKEGMEYRRFGKTERHLSVITLGGMRFLHGWDEPRNVIPSDTLEQGIRAVQNALNCGINHIETAWGYKKSETLYGKILNEELFIPRTSYYLMTKGNPLTADETLERVENQLRHLQTDYLDFYGWHGINNEELRSQACKSGGPVETLLRLKEEGVIRHVGFSTHAPRETIIKTIETDLFEFVNLHYYYFDQRNLKAVEEAAQRDMGVFIISPNDKGGQLFKAPDKVKHAISPLTPIQWNARFCLKNKDIHTLSFGITEDQHFEEMKGIFNPTVEWSENDQTAQSKLDEYIKDDPFAWYDGFDLLDDPSGINIPAVLRLRKLWKCYDMEDYARYRYKLFQQKDHWFPGLYASELNIDKVDLSRVPVNIPLKQMLLETHKKLYETPTYRLAKE